MRLLYTFFIHIYISAIRFSALHSLKAKRWVEGRKNWKTKLSGFNPGKKPVVWFHAASLGEFEQGRPVIEAFRKNYPEYYLLLTFFSPSGYEIRKNYSGADLILYLPADFSSNALFFLDCVNPKMVFFIKYEYWFNFMNELRLRKIPLYVISAIFRPSQHFFKPWGKWFRKQLNAVDYFFVQNDESIKLLQSIGFQNAIISGDTRFDRVCNVVANQESFPLIEKFSEDHKIILAGSSWFPDETLLANIIQQLPDNTRIIIAPHEVDEKRIQEIKNIFPHKTVRLSEAGLGNISLHKILIIDGIGFLSKLYRYADIAYIGGGFGKGIHNILEAAAYGVPVIIGPNYARFKEACDLVRHKGAYTVQNQEDLYKICSKLLTDDALWQKSSEICANYVQEQKGATEIIIKHVQLQF